MKQALTAALPHILEAIAEKAKEDYFNNRWASLAGPASIWIERLAETEVTP
jgi:hypothetical protein